MEERLESNEDKNRSNTEISENDADRIPEKKKIRDKSEFSIV